jgi:DNA primase
LIKEREQRELKPAYPSSDATLPSETASSSDVTSSTDAPTETVETVETVEKESDGRITRKQYPFKKFETALIRYVVRYGERVLFLNHDTKQDENKQKVAEYIRTELAYDDIEIQMPIYKRILDEALAQYENETFVASRYFLTHTDLEISEIAANMMSNKYQLSKFFETANDVAMTQINLTDDRQKAEYEERKKELELIQLEKWIIQDIFEIKNAYNKHQIEEVNKQIKELQSDEEQVVELIKKRIELDKIKRVLGNELGGRVVTGMGK